MTTTQYKDFFELTNYLETDNLDFTYRKVVISEKNLHQSSDNKITSFEKFNAEKTLAIFNFLKYKLHSEKDELQREWLEKNISFFNNTLSNIKNDKTFITPEHIFINQKYEKVHYNNDKTIGRLYSLNSIQTLPRELRYYIFKDEYVDFDIANAHPCILYLYSEKHKLKLNGTLKNYIKNKTSVMSMIQSEINLLQPKGTPDLHISSVKEKVLVLLNQTWGDLENGERKNESKTLSLLGKDFKIIRNHLWEAFSNGELEGYAKAIDQSISKKKKKYMSESGVVNINKLNLLKKIILQSFYCQTQETEHLIKLIVFLREKYSTFIINDGKNKFIDYYPYTDKKVKLGAKHTLSVVPFFDGLYISSPCQNFMINLPRLVEEYNSINDEVTFVRKEIVEHRSRITDTDELRKFMIINSWLSKSASKLYLDRLLSKTEIHEQAVALLLDQRNFCERSTHELDSPEIEEEWEHRYGDKVASLKHMIFKKLLSYPIENPSDINQIIGKL